MITPSSPTPDPNFLPNKPSPNRISYFSSLTSCKKKTLDVWSTSFNESETKYSIPKPEVFSSFLTYTWRVDVSIDGLSNINFWSNELSNLNCFVINVPCLIGKFSKFAT